MLTKRQNLILKIIIEEYVQNAEPIGSRTLSKLNKLKVSPATIRNEMADLEEVGFLQKTHTSSGRIPSDDGYRYYVKNLMEKDSNSEYELIDNIFKSQKTKEEIIKDSIKTISKITNCATFGLDEDNKDTIIKKIDVIKLSDDKAMILVVTDNGNIEKEEIKINSNEDIEIMKNIIKTLSDVLQNSKLKDAKLILEKEIFVNELESYINYRELIIENFIKAFAKFAEKQNYYQSGQSNILYQPEFNNVNKVRELLASIEEKEIFKIIDQSTDSLSVKIGNENKVHAMKDCTIISVPYKLKDNAKGTIAVVGPTRMNYEKVIPLLEYLASNMNKL